MCSRFSSLIELRRDPEIEIARINAFKISCYFFLLEQFDEQPVRFSREIFIELWKLASDENCLRQQAFWHTGRGPLLNGKKSNNITLIDVLNVIGYYLAEHIDDFDIQEAIITK